MFPHVCDVEGRKVVERNVGELGLRTARTKVHVRGKLPHISS